MLLSDKDQQKRLDICNSCEFKRDDFKLFNVILLKREAQCKVCKCFIQAKTSFEFSKCPKGKWG